MKEREIIAVMCRGKTKRVIWSSRYLKIDNAIPRLTFHLMRTGQPGDGVELSHAVTGLQIGTMKLSANNVLKSEWIWDKGYTPEPSIKVSEG